MCLKKVLSVLCIIAIIFSINVSASESEILTVDSALVSVLNNSADVYKVINEEKHAKWNYDENEYDSRGINTEYATFTIFGQEHKFYFNDATVAMLRLQKEFMPMQYKFMYDMKKMERGIIENSLKNVSRELFLGLYSTYNDTLQKEAELKLANEKYSQDLTKYEQGIITSLDFELSEYEKNKAEKALDKSVRSYENMIRSFEGLSGLELDASTLVTQKQDMTNPLYYDVEVFINKALENRMEIVSLRKQIELKEKELELYSYKNLHINNKDFKKRYETAELDYKKLSVQLEIALADVEGEIRVAYVDIKKEIDSIKGMEILIEQQKDRVEKYRLQYEQGFIPESVVKQMENILMQLENGLYTSKIMFNNKGYKFKAATEIGPAYGGR